MTDGGQAFPTDDGDGIWRSGMSLRDYFAAQGMSAVKGVVLEKWIASVVDAAVHGVQPIQDKFPEVIAHIGYAIADAMLAERAKEKP